MLDSSRSWASVGTWLMHTAVLLAALGVLAQALLDDLLVLLDAGCGVVALEAHTDLLGDEHELEREDRATLLLLEKGYLGGDLLLVQLFLSRECLREVLDLGELVVPRFLGGAGGVLDDLEPDGELALRGGGFPEVQGEPVERVVASLEPRITLALHDALNLLDSLLQAFELVVYLVHVGHADGHRRALERDVGDGLGL